MLRARTHDEIRNVHRLTSIAAKEGEATDAFKEAFGHYCYVRSGFSEVLNKTYIHTKRQITDGTQVPDTFIHPSTGLFYYNERNIKITYMLRDSSQVANYYRNLRGQFYHTEAICDACNDPGDKVPHYTTSFSLIPKDKAHGLPSDFSSINQPDICQDDQIPLKIYGNITCPVVGYLLDRFSMESIINMYDGHPFYSMYVRHVLWALCRMSHNARVFHRKRSTMQVRQDSVIKLEAPFVGRPVNTNPVTLHTGHKEIMIYDEQYQVQQPFCAQGEPGLPWTTLSPDLIHVIARQPPDTCYGSHKITHLNLRIHVVTYAIRENVVEKDLDQNDSHLPDEFIQEVQAACPDKNILAQVVEVSGSYFPLNNSTFQPNATLKFVTVNRGLYTIGETLPDVRMIMHHFGYGLPIQTQIHSTPYNFYGYNHSTLPAELPLYAMDTALYEVLNRLTSKEMNTEGHTVIRDADTRQVSHLIQDFPDVTAGTDREPYKFHEILCDSMKKSFNRRDLKTDPYNGRPIYHYMSYCKPYFQMLVMGSASPRLFQPIRAARVLFGIPVGNMKVTAYAPGWDRVGTEDIMSNDMVSHGAGSAPSSPRSGGRIPSSEFAVPASRGGSDGAGGAGGGGRPAAGGERGAGGGGRPAAGGCGAGGGGRGRGGGRSGGRSGSGQSDTMSREPLLYTSPYQFYDDLEATASTHFVDDELDIEQVLRAAALPSVFDEEVYM